MSRYSLNSIGHHLRTLIRVTPILFLVATISLLAGGCVPTPEDERLISARGDLPYSVSSGNCEQVTSSNRLHSQLWSRTGLAPEHISVLNWNIYKTNKDGWREDLHSLGADKDLILLQEAYLDDEFQENLDTLSTRGIYWNFNSAFSYKGAAAGVMIASRVSPVESCGLQEMEPLLGLPKTALVSLYTLANSNKQLLVANIHGVNFTLGTATYRKQFQALKKLLDDHRGPIILAGDFNNWSDKRSEVINELANGLGLKALSFDEDERTRVFSTPIDHIFYRGLEVVSNDVHPVQSSDHNPITAAFRVQRQLVTQASEQ